MSDRGGDVSPHDRYPDIPLGYSGHTVEIATRLQLTNSTIVTVVIRYQANEKHHPSLSEAYLTQRQ